MFPLESAFFIPLELVNDGIHIIDAATPDSATGLHQCGPEPRVIG